MCNYYGGKKRMMNIIPFLLAICRVWVDAFGGSGAVTLNSPQYTVQILNDIDSDMANLLWVLREKYSFHTFMSKIETVKYSKYTFEEAKRISKTPGYTLMPEVDRAVITYIMLVMSFNSNQKSYSNKGDNGQLDLVKKIDGLVAVHNRLQGVNITNVNALGLVEQYRYDPEAMLYLDVPYPLSTRTCRAYKYEMSDKDHLQLIELVRDASASVMISNYQNSLYDNLGDGWTRYEICRLTKSSSSQPKKGKGVEVAYCNYELPSIARSYIDFSKAERLTGGKPSVTIGTHKKDVMLNAKGGDL